MIGTIFTMLSIPLLIWFIIDQNKFYKEIGEMLERLEVSNNLAIKQERKDAQEEYRQFILNVLDGIDEADGECNTKAIRLAIKSRIIG